MRKLTREALAEADPDLLFADGFDAAIIGVIQRALEDPFVVYDARKCVRIVMRRDRITRDDAREQIEMLTEEWDGDRTPAFLWLAPRDEEDDDDE